MMTQTLLILLAALLTIPVRDGHWQSPATPAPAAKEKARPNEISLARLRPGKDTISAANRLYDPALRNSLPGSSGQPEWYDACTGYFLRVETDEKGTIESVTISALGPRRDDCAANAPDFLHRRLWKSGRGLALGDPRKRVLQLYGQPDSSGPSTQQGRELQLLFYSYEELGTDVPQVMEITLERDRVVQITLAFPGL